MSYARRNFGICNLRISYRIFLLCSLVLMLRCASLWLQSSLETSRAIQLSFPRFTRRSSGWCLTSDTVLRRVRAETRVLHGLESGLASAWRHHRKFPATCLFLYINVFSLCVPQYVCGTASLNVTVAASLVSASFWRYIVEDHFVLETLWDTNCHRNYLAPVLHHIVLIWACSDRWHLTYLYSEVILLTFQQDFLSISAFSHVVRIVK